MHQHASRFGLHKELNAVPLTVLIAHPQHRFFRSRGLEQCLPQFRGICPRKPERLKKNTRFMPSTRTTRIQAIVTQLSDVDYRPVSIGQVHASRLTGRTLARNIIPPHLCLRSDQRLIPGST
jgi:hypothetical protein